MMQPSGSTVSMWADGPEHLNESREPCCVRFQTGAWESSEAHSAVRAEGWMLGPGRPGVD